MFPWDASVLTPTRPSFVMAATKARSNAAPLRAHASTVGLDLESVNSSWSELSRPIPPWRFLKYWLSNARGVTVSMGTAVRGSTLGGHHACSCAANRGLSVGSVVGRSRPANVRQWASPTVCPPSCTASQKERITSEFGYVPFLYYYYFGFIRVMTPYDSSTVNIKWCTWTGSKKNDVHETRRPLLLRRWMRACEEIFN